MSNERFPRGWFKLLEEDADEVFDRFPRQVVDLDDDAIGALRDFYDEHLQNGWQILELMSSWRSHLPKMKSVHLIGLGMNEHEMYDNPQLDDYYCHNLNTTPALPFEDNHFDAVLCAVSVQDLIWPLEVFREVARVLKPGGPFFVSISNCYFPTKAIAIWRQINDAAGGGAGLCHQQHIQLVAAYFQASEAFSAIQAEDHSPAPSHSNPLFIIWGYAK